MAHAHFQNGEGWCWPALLEAELASRGITEIEKGRDLRDVLAERTGFDETNGSRNEYVVDLLEGLGIPWYAEENCPERRWERLLRFLPERYTVVASIWDSRDRDLPPGEEPPEVHMVAPIEIFQNGDGHKRISFYDPDTFVGGLLGYRFKGSDDDCTLEKWMEWWHEDPKDLQSGQNRSVPKDCLDNPHNHFFVIIGADAAEVYKYVGPPEALTNDK